MLKTKLIDEVLYQQCSKCGEWKVATTEFFPPCRTGKNGIRGNCWTCRKLYQSDYYKQYHVDNKEKLNEQCRIYSINNKEKLKLYRYLHPQKYRPIPYDAKQVKRQRIYYENNTERIIERKREYRSLHKEEYRMHAKRNSAKRRMKSSNAPVTLTKEQWDLCKEYFYHSCAYCGRSIHLAQDHFVPLSKGGEYAKSNIIPSCTSCNSGKRDRDFFTWYPTFKHYSEQREIKILNYLGYKNQKQQLSIF